MATKSVLIGGGRGFIGQALSQRLMQKGYSVTILSRNIKSNPTFCNHLLTWDSIKQNGLPKCSAVVNLAGKNIMFPYNWWSKEFKNELFDSRINTSSLLSSLIQESQEPPEVYISASAVGYYPSSESNIYDEDSIVPESERFFDIFVDLCHQWEEAARLPKTHTGTRHVTVRTGLVLGRQGGLIKYSITPFYLGVGGLLGLGAQWFPWIHIQDLVGIYIHAITHPDVHGILNGVSPGICENEQFAEAFAKALNRRACLPVPDWVIRNVFGKERARLILEGQNVKPKRTLDSGYKFICTDINSAAREFAHLF